MKVGTVRAMLVIATLLILFQGYRIWDLERTVDTDRTSMQVYIDGRKAARDREISAIERRIEKVEGTNAGTK